MQNLLSWCALYDFYVLLIKVINNAATVVEFVDIYRQLKVKMNLKKGYLWFITTWFYFCNSIISISYDNFIFFLPAVSTLMCF